jgi:hypothetical protein
LTQAYSKNEAVLILSSDKDFVQLQIYPNVKQYSPTMKKFIQTNDPIKQLNELIVTGDKGDGIPNILSPDTCIIDGIRQKSVTKKFLEEVAETGTSKFNETQMRNWSRNKQLIDLTMIPGPISKNIIDTYIETKPATRQQFMNYMIANRLKNLLEVIDEF